MRALILALLLGMMTLVVLGLTANACAAQVSVEVEFQPQSFELSDAAVTTLDSMRALGYTPVAIVGHADALPNLSTGMHNEDLAHYRAMMVKQALLGCDCQLDVVTDTRRAVVVTYVRVPSVSGTIEVPGIGTVSVEGNSTDPSAFDEVVGYDNALIDSMLNAHANALTRLHNDNSRNKAEVDSREQYLNTLSEYERACQLVNRSPLEEEAVRHPNIWNIRREFHVLGDQYHTVLTSASSKARNLMGAKHGTTVRGTWDENRSLRDSIDMRRKLLVTRGNFAYRMWRKYDAYRGWKENRPGAVLPNGSGYHQQGWGVGARKLRNEVINKYGREIPFLGWDEKLYEEYYRDHSVFPVGEDNNPTAKKTSYKQSGNPGKLGATKARRKVVYFIRSLSACRKA